MLACSAWAPVTGKVVVDTFLQAGNTHGLPASTLTDNGRACTARFGGGRDAFEYLIAALGITQKNGSPNHPQTQGEVEVEVEVERFHQTQKRWLARQPPAATLPDLQRQLNAFREHYNEHRPNRALQRSTPARPTGPCPKAPAAAPRGYYRLRYDHVDTGGKVSIRHAGRMHHLGIGAVHHGKEILAIADPASVTVIELRTGEVLSAHDIDPGRAISCPVHRVSDYWLRLKPGAGSFKYRSEGNRVVAGNTAYPDLLANRE
jgi:integrase-like protein